MKTVLLSIMLLVAAASAVGDVVHLRNGTSREGRIVEENDERIVLEIRAGTATARVTISPADVDRIERKLTPEQEIDREYKARLDKLDRKNAGEVIALARWCVDKNRFETAEGLLKALWEQGGDHFVRGHLALAEIEIDRKRLDFAKEQVAAVLKVHPENLQAAGMSERLRRMEEETLREMANDAKRLYDAGKFDQALKKVEAFHDRATSEQAKAALAGSAVATPAVLEELAAEARLRGAEAKGMPVKLGPVPDWEVPALARAIERRLDVDKDAFEKVAKTLDAGVADELLIATASQAAALHARAAGWLDALAALERQKPGVTERKAQDERTLLDARFFGICIKLGDAFLAAAQKAWTEVTTGTEGPLALDKKVREASEGAGRAVTFYDYTRETRTGKLPAAVATRSDNAGKLRDESARAVKHNDDMMKAYNAARVAYDRSRLDLTLQALTVLVQNGGKLDLLWLSNKARQDVRMTLPDWMAGCRFELGKKDAKFGSTIDYERAAFVQKLLQEAGAKGTLAHADYERMVRFLDLGRRGDVPASMVRRTRENAQDARRWYRAVFDVPYPLSTAKRKEIDDDVDELDHIISRCRRWYVGGPTVPIGP